jgi:dephospho-CoA kinase
MPTHDQGYQHKRLVVGLTGRIGTGKTSGAKYLSSKYNFQYIRYSQVLAEWQTNEPQSKIDLQEIGWKVMAGGMQIDLNRRLTEKILPAPVDVVVDGLRHRTDYDFLKESFGSSFHLLYIESPREARWNRLKHRDKYRSLEAFERVDAHSVEQQIESLRIFATSVLHNDGSLQDLYRALDKVIQQLRKEG